MQYRKVQRLMINKGASINDSFTGEAGNEAIKTTVTLGDIVLTWLRKPQGVTVGGEKVSAITAIKIIKAR